MRRKSSLADEVGQRYEEIKYRDGKVLYNRDVLQAVIGISR